MSNTIVVLLILLIIFQFISIAGNTKTADKKSAIKYYSQKLKDEQDNDGASGARVTAYLSVLALRCAIIYYAVISILSFIK